MTMGRRQLVLAALVVALGAAVYLNWVFSGGGQLKATEAVASGADRQYGQTLLVNGAVSSSEAASETEEQTAAPVDSEAAGTAAAASDGYFSEARLKREKAQDEVKETVAQVFADAESDDELKKEAAAKTAALIQNLLTEADIETLVKAKGFEDCVVTLGGDQCSVVVKTKENSENDAAVIQDIVAGQTGLSYDKIRIIERS
jgi:stage III sporulation protein AH